MARSWVSQSRGGSLSASFAHLHPDLDRTRNKGAATYTYDALGRIATKKTIGTSIDTFSYLASTKTAWQIANAGGSGITTKSALDATGARTAVTGNALTGYLGFDLHGNTALAENGSKTITDALRYDAWGELIASTTSALPTPWRYQGRLDVGPDAANPLYDFGARDYRPLLGAFTSLDSYAGQAIDPLSMNRFLYAEANPATFVDPDGHCARYIDDICNDHRNDAAQQQAAAAQHQADIRRRQAREDALETAYIKNAKTARPAPSNGSGEARWGSGRDPLTLPFDWTLTPSAIRIQGPTLANTPTTEIETYEALQLRVSGIDLDAPDVTVRSDGTLIIRTGSSVLAVSPMTGTTVIQGASRIRYLDSGGNANEAKNAFGVASVPGAVTADEEWRSGPVLDPLPGIDHALSYQWNLNVELNGHSYLQLQGRAETHVVVRLNPSGWAVVGGSVVAAAAVPLLGAGGLLLPATQVSQQFGQYAR